jgi:asparagine synthase (glutamine-hydrolysing)
MCGIVGCIQTGEHVPLRGAVRRAMDHMVHRGPDGQGLEEFIVRNGTASSTLGAPPIATVLFGHRRLAIIDLSEAARQPMSTPDGQFHLSFNGEIYNYREIRAELKNLGHSFRTSSDAEVLLEGWRRWGKALLPRLIGMFAFAVFDSEQASVLLARDPFGIKPLYYVQDRHRLVFASEIAPLLEVPAVSRRAHPQTVYDFLSGAMGELGDRTFFQDVRQLPAGHYLAISCASPGTAEPVCYWELERKRAQGISPQEASSGFRDLFEQSIRLHLRSDVPVGVSLSGGMDSSSITAMVRAVQGPETPLHAFSYVAEDPELSEEGWSRTVARAMAAKQHLVYVHPNELVEDFRELVRVQEQPFGSPTIYAQYRIFRSAHEVGVKVVLTGQGADQYLGYIRHLSVRFATLVRTGRWLAAIRFLRHARALPRSAALSLRGVLRQLLPASLVETVKRVRSRPPLGANPGWFRERGIRFSGTHWTEGKTRSLHDLLRQNLLEALPALLRFEDRNAMAFSVENRVPFLTADLLNFVFSLPEEEIISADGRCKAVLLRAMRGLVPKEVLERRDKIGFAMPVSKLNRQTGSWLHSVLRGAAAIPALDAADLERRVNLTLYDPASDTESQRWLWRWLSLITWASEFQVRFE